MSKTQPLLIVEDNPHRVEVFESWIKHAKLPCQLRVVWAKAAGSAIGLLKRDQGRVYAGILLDHDLDLQNLTNFSGQYSGKDVVKAIIEYVDLDVPVMVHSTNVTGGPDMASKLRGAGFTVELAPFNDLNFGIYKDWLSYVCESAQT